MKLVWEKSRRIFEKETENLRFNKENLLFVWQNTYDFVIVWYIVC